MNPYLLMVALFAVAAIVQAADAALVSAGLLPAFSGIRWLRIHFVTLGMMTEGLYGALPLVLAWRAGLPRPRVDWVVWATLNGGLLALLVGIPSLGATPVYVGGALVSVATVLLYRQLRAIRAAGGARAAGPSGTPFYLTGLAFFLVGITVGTGLNFNWAAPLRILTPIEVHIHANNWGLMSLVFAGLIIDLCPRWTGRSLAWPGATRPILWMLSAGALGLVLGPWTGSRVVLVPGLLLHLAATIWLLANAVLPLRGTGLLRAPGLWHLTTGYLWLLAPVLIAPLILFEVPGFPGAGIEQNAPQALVYGWLLQGGFALLPYFARRALRNEERTPLGGSWLSLAAVHAGSALLWGGLFLDPVARGWMHGGAYALWTLSLIPIARDLWAILTAGAQDGEGAAGAPIS